MAFELFEEMKRKKLSPTVSTYSSLIKCCELLNQFEKAMALFQEMLKEGVKPDTIAYTAIVTACAQSKRWKTALGLIDRMIEDNIKVRRLISTKHAFSFYTFA